MKINSRACQGEPLIALLLGVFIPYAAGQAAELADVSAHVGTVHVTAISSSSIALAIPIKGDTNNNGFATLDFATSPEGPFEINGAHLWLSGPPNAGVRFGGGALKPNSTYYIRVSFTDPDGVDGTNPQIIGPIVTLSASQSDSAATTASVASEAQPGVTANLTSLETPDASRPIIGSGASSADCGAINVSGQYRIFPNGEYHEGIYLEQPFAVNHDGDVNYPNLYFVVPVPLGPTWKLLGNARVTYCYHPSGNYLVPLPNVLPGQTSSNLQLTDYTTSGNPSVLAPYLFQQNLPLEVISGLPSR